jgi:hypothetical protein
MLSYLNVRDKKQKQTHGLSLLKINRKWKRRPKFRSSKEKKGNKQ